MTSIIIFAPVLFYRLLIFRSFFALGGQLIILHGNDNGIAFFYLICQDHLGCQGLHVLLDITLQRPCTVDRIISIVHDILHSFLRQTDGQLLILQTSVQIGNDQMNDADHTWVNGVLVGGRSNVYEPRDYPVAAGVLRAGANEIRMRLVVERPGGRVTPGKRMTLTIGDDIFDLSGIWQYAVTAEADRDCPFEDFVRWKPTGLYNAMLAPCFPYAVRAVLWYQGESNTGDYAMRYGDELKAMIELWRGKWHQLDMPFLIVQLPKFGIDAIEDGGWPLIREQEWRVADELEHVAAVVTLDAGESNDLHPHDKKTIADRAFNVAMDFVYGQQAQPQPVVETAEADDGLLRMHCVWRNSMGEQMQSQNRHLMTLDGDVPREIDFLWHDCATSVRAEAWLDGCDIVARIPSRMPDEVRYAWSNSPESGLICDGDGVLLPPFHLPLPMVD